MREGEVGVCNFCNRVVDRLPTSSRRYVSVKMHEYPSRIPLVVLDYCRRAPLLLYMSTISRTVDEGGMGYGSIVYSPESLVRI
jgi:hypothetical protein